jgi:hypothetical protein
MYKVGDRVRAAKAIGNKKDTHPVPKGTPGVVTVAYNPWQQFAYEVLFNGHGRAWLVKHGEVKA